jgi:predicted PurR-regulated permease PerM
MGMGGGGAVQSSSALTERLDSAQLVLHRYLVGTSIILGLTAYGIKGVVLGPIFCIAIFELWHSL